jgi:GTP pyrophosphokinase
MNAKSPIFSEALGDALQYVLQIHGTQQRKTGAGEKSGHLLGVAALVIEDNGSEAEVIAALLHDSIEDTEATAAYLEQRFGPQVAAIVVGCTDAEESTKPPWRQRKERYLAHLPSASPSVLRVSNADKLYNARTIVADVRQLGDRLWDRFNTDKDETLWYYRELSRIFAESNPGYLADELRRTVEQMHRLAK